MVQEQISEKNRYNPFYVTAALYLGLDALAVALVALANVGMVPALPGLAWLRVHLLTIGVLVDMVLGSLPRLTAERFAVEPPGRRFDWLLWSLVNGSLLLLLVGMPGNLPWLAALGGVGILLALVLVLAAVLGQWRRSPSSRDPIAAYYIAGPIFFIVGILMALSMLLAWPAPGGLFGILEAHVHANVWGFLALVVAGYLLNHVPSWLERPLRYPALVRPTLWLLVVGASGLVAGPWLNILPMTVVGIAVYVTGTLLLVANLIGTVAAARGWTPNLAHLGVAYVWMLVPAVVAPTILLLTGKLPTGGVETAAVAGLIAGWVLQVVLGALPLRLGARGPRAAADGRWFSVVALNLGVALIWASAFWTDFDSARLIVAFGYLMILAGWLPPLVPLMGRLMQPAAGDAL